MTTSLSHDVNLDISQQDALKLSGNGDGSAPDVIITPSKLKQFAKVCSIVFHGLVEMVIFLW